MSKKISFSIAATVIILAGAIFLFIEKKNSAEDMTYSTESMIVQDGKEVEQHEFISN